jgi:tetratricopeptide (TPR) repeat protein
LLLILSVHSFGISQKAIEYYSAGELSYKSGDYSTALRNYELSISMDPAIEGYDSQLKFKMGISAYMIGEYDKARSYLSSYNNDLVDALLNSISQRKQQDEWKKWISQYKPSEIPSGTEIPVETKKKGTSSFLIMFLVFIITFSFLFFAEFRVYKLRKRVIELPAKPSEETAQSVNIVSNVKEEAITISEELPEEWNLIPKDAKIVDFEQLINSEIDVFKDIFEQLSVSTESVEKSKVEEGIENNISESTTEIPSEGKNEELIENEREKLVEDILGETKELIADLGKESEDIKKEERSENEVISQVELESMESEMLSKLKLLSEEWTDADKIEASQYEDLQKDFSEFDTIEKITEKETKILVEKLIILREGSEEQKN